MGLIEETRLLSALLHFRLKTIARSTKISLTPDAQHASDQRFPQNVAHSAHPSNLTFCESGEARPVERGLSAMRPSI